MTPRHEVGRLDPAAVFVHRRRNVAHAMLLVGTMTLLAGGVA